MHQGFCNSLGVNDWFWTSRKTIFVPIFHWIMQLGSSHNHPHGYCQSCNVFTTKIRSGHSRTWIQSEKPFLTYRDSSDWDEGSLIEEASGQDPWDPWEPRIPSVPYTFVRAYGGNQPQENNVTDSWNLTLTMAYTRPENHMSQSDHW
jgi:hypothetical protein